MKIKNAALLLVSMGLLGGLTGITTHAVHAAPLPDKEDVHFYAVGEFCGWDPSNPWEFQLNEEGTRYELLVSLEAGDGIKFSFTKGANKDDWDGFNSHNNNWINQNEFRINTDNFYVENSNDWKSNWLCKTTGVYEFYVNVADIATAGNVAENIVQGGNKVEASECTVTYVLADGSMEEVTAPVGIPFNAPWKFAEDMYFRGWYLDEDFATPYDNSKPLMDSITLYGRWVTAEADDYWIYIETYVSNPLDNVYYWNSATDAKTAWEGDEVQIATKAPLAPKAAEGTEIYRIKIKAEYEADKILFHNGKGGNSNQTIDLDLPGEPTIYWVEAAANETGKINGGIFADSDSWVESLAFLDYWSTIRIDNDVYEDKTYNNSICHLLTDTEAWNELNSRYTALSTDAKGLVDPVTDVEGWTVGQTMEYLTNAHSEPAVGPAASVFFSEPENIAGITAGTLVLVSILGFSVFYFVRRRKHASN